MSKVLTVEQREQAGSDSYNRFEYQVHCIVCHIIGKLKEESECVVFCEFHDDMAEFTPSTQQYQFYQIKTKEDPSEWTISEMSKKEKKKTGEYKKSFLGFIFYNYLIFGEECSHCFFVSNNDFDAEVLLWQSYIEDGKELQKENFELYQKIKNRISDEFSKYMPNEFDLVFNKFIQNTFISKSDLQLTTYENQSAGKFFEHLANKNIAANTANLIFQQLVSDVRKKSKEKIKMPISMKKLIEKKGVNIEQVNKKINDNINDCGKYNLFYDFLKSLSLTEKDVNRIISAKTLHDTRWLNINDLKYQEIVVVLRKIISTYAFSLGCEKDINELKKVCFEELENKCLQSDVLDDSLIEVLYYEQRFNQNS